MILYLNPKGDDIMFQVKIDNGENEKKYYVFGEHEYTIIGEIKPPILAHRNYYDMEVKTENSITMKNPSTTNIVINQYPKKQEEDYDDYDDYYDSRRNSDVDFHKTDGGQTITSSSRKSVIYTNNCPVIIDSSYIDGDWTFQRQVSFGQPLTIEEYEILYELYLEQMEKNPTPEYLEEQEIKSDIKSVKTLLNIHKRA